MTYRNTIRALAAALALAGAFTATTPAFATEPVEVVVVTGTALSEPAAAVNAMPCDGSTADDARKLANDAKRSGAHRRAAECYRAAGDHARADKALMRASAATGAETSRKASVTADTARDQLKRVRAAFR